MTKGSLRSMLDQLAESLDGARRLFLSKASPSPGELQSVVVRVEECREALAGLTGGLEADALASENRMETARKVQSLKSQLAVVMRLVSGSAWFASLVKELDRSAPVRGIYGPRGANGGGPSAPSIERKV